MAELEAFLVNSLYRSACPEALELEEFQMGLVAPERAKAIREHLRECRLCSGEARVVEAFHKIVAPDLEISPVERIKTWVASLLPAAPAGDGLSPAFGLRGDIGQVMAYQAGDSQLSLSIEIDPENPERRALMGLLMGVPLDCVHINLFHGERKSTLGLVDDLGNFTIVGVKPGLYDLTLRGQTFEIYVPSLRVD